MKTKRARPDAGFTLAGLICLLTAVAVTTAVMVPLRAMESRREQEKELIFRGEEFVRAIQKYQRKYQAYPASVDDLIARDGYRFLRKQYKDPISGEDFRLINVNPDGTLNGSTTMLTLPVSNQARPVGTTPGALPGGTTPGALPSANTGQNPSNSSTNNNPVGSGVGTGTGAFGGGGTFGSGFGNTTGTGGNPLGTGTGNNTQNPNNTGRPANAFGGGTTGAPGAASAIPGNNPFGGGNTTPQISPGVAGVGSQSTGNAVMVYNTKEKYNEWEFITPLEQPTGVPNGQSPPNGQTGPNGQPGPNGQVPNGPNGRQNQTGPNTNPFGQSPIAPPGSPVQGGAFGTNQGFGGNPFGTGQSAPANGRR